MYLLPSSQSSYASVLSRYAPARKAWLCLLIIVGCAFSSAAGWAEWPEAPQNAVHKEPVSFALADLDALDEGKEFEFQLPGNGITLASGERLAVISGLVTHAGGYLNGDRVLRGIDRNRDINFVLTLGRESLFADFGIDGQRWVISASRYQQQLRGWMYQPDGAMAEQPTSDFVIPRRDGRAAITGALSLESAGFGTVSEAASNAGLQISQHFSHDVVTLAEQQEIEVTVTVSNQGGSGVSQATADIYFILEDAELVSAPSSCRRHITNTSPPQPVLSCELGGTLAAGATRSFSYLVRVGPHAEPTRIASTVFVGNVRHDAVINVVNNVVGDEVSLQGLSPFNQNLYEQSNIDRLGNVVIDVMALYTPDAQNVYGIHTATRINQLISVANQLYHDSGIGITLRPVYHGRVDYAASQADMHTMLDQLTFADHPAFRHVPTLRERYGADLVVLFRPLAAEPSTCGLANLGGYRTNGDMTAFNEGDYAYSLAAIDCPVSSVLAHELGHNMGLTHSHREDGGGGTFDFATGHGVDHGFTTVMANPSAFNGAQRLPLFSSPRLDCGGMPCGVDHNDPEHGADAVRTLNLVRFQVANYMPTRIPNRPFRQVGNIDGSPTAASIALSATTDNGLSNAESVALSQMMDISADFYIAPEHIGQQGYFHVLADLTSAGMGFVQLNNQGEAFDWDGDVARLVPFNATGRLNAVEYLRILSDFRPLPELAGTPIVLFVAYRLAETDELIYTLEPLVVQIGARP